MTTPQVPETRRLYQQIADQIMERQKSGAFPPGFRLPPTRTLSRQLGVHRNTVLAKLTAWGIQRPTSADGRSLSL